jgi:hypothetical protein
VQEDNSNNRRSFLVKSAQMLGALGFSAITPVVIGQSVNVTEDESNIPTLDTRLKFNPDGTRRAFAGNTVICRLQQQGSARRTIEALVSDLKRSSITRKISILPSESYHMTIYPGVNDQRRDITGWPSDVAKEASIEECDRIVTQHMRQFHLLCELPIRMRVDGSKSIANKRASTLRMVGANDVEEHKIRTIRDRLVDTFHFRDRNHDDYGFHITVAYQLLPFTSAEQAEYHQILLKNIPLIMTAAPVFEFGNPEFCTFPDMFVFDTKLLLAS